MSTELTLLNDVDQLLSNILKENVDELRQPDSVIDFGPPPEKNPPKTGLSLFLYQVTENPYLKNQEFGQTSPTSLKYPPIALDLYYLVTPFSSSNIPNVAQAVEKMILAKVVRTFYNNAILRGPLLGDALLDSGNTELRLVLNNIPLEQIYQLWTIFDNAFFRLSSSFTVTPLKIPSDRELATKRVITKQLDSYQVRKNMT